MKLLFIAIDRFSQNSKVEIQILQPLPTNGLAIEEINLHEMTCNVNNLSTNTINEEISSQDNLSKSLN